MSELIDFTGTIEADGLFRDTDPGEYILTIVSFSEKARREGLLALEDDLPELDNSLFRSLLQLVVDGTDPELVRTIGENLADQCLEELEQFHDCVKFLLNNCHRRDVEQLFRRYVDSRDIPRLSGLLDRVLRQQMDLRNAGEISADSDISPRMREILEVFLSDLDADFKRKLYENHFRALRDRAEAECRIILDGVLAIQSGDNPRIVRDKLCALVNRGTLERLAREGSLQAEGD